MIFIFITQGILICLFVVQNIFSTGLIYVCILKLCVLVIIIQILFLLHRCFLSKANRYIPTVNLLVSEDNGKTYSNNLKAIPLDKVIYLKYEISIKANGLWWLLFGNTIAFNIDISSEIKLCDYTYCKCEPQSKENFFTIIASSKPKKSEIVFMIPGHATETPLEIGILFKKNVHDAYNKTTTLKFIKETNDEAKSCESSQKNLDINIKGTIT